MTWKLCQYTVSCKTCYEFLNQYFVAICHEFKKKNCCCCNLMMMPRKMTRTRTTDVVAPRSGGPSAHRAGEDADEDEDDFADRGEDDDEDDDADDYDGVDDDPLVLEGEERNLTWLWDKVRDSSSSGMTTAKCKDAVRTFHNILSDCIEEVEGASNNRRKLDLLLGYERDARACVSSLLSGKAGILLQGSHFSRVSDIPLPATVSGARNACRPERFRGRQDEHD